MTLEDFLSPGDGVIDIGANVGHFTGKYAKIVGRQGSVLALEPDPETADYCRSQHAHLMQVMVMTAAVTDEAGTATLYRDKDRKRNSLWPANLLEASGDFVTCRTVTLDWLAKMIPNLRGIKIDAQGAEAQIFAGAAETLARPGVVWAIELWPEGLREAGSHANDVIRTLAAAGLDPVGCTWAHVRDGVPRQRGHGAIDIVVKHREAESR